MGGNQRRTLHFFLLMDIVMQIEEAVAFSLRKGGCLLKTQQVLVVLIIAVSLLAIALYYRVNYLNLVLNRIGCILEQTRHPGLDVAFTSYLEQPDQETLVYLAKRWDDFAHTWEAYFLTRQTKYPRKLFEQFNSQYVLEKVEAGGTFFLVAALNGYSDVEDVYQAVNATYEAWQLFEQQPYTRHFGWEEWLHPFMYLMDQVEEAVVVGGADRENGYNLRFDIRYRK